MTSDSFSVPKTPEHKQHLAESLLRFYANGGAPWNKGKRGVQKGRVWTKAQKLALSLKTTGVPKPRNGCSSPTTHRAKLARQEQVFFKKLLGLKDHPGRVCTEITTSQRKKLSVALKKARRSYAPIWNKGLRKCDHPSLVQMAETMSKNTSGVPRPYKSKKQGKRRFWYYGTGLRIKMRSRWEVAYAHYLDGIKQPWLYECCTFVMDTCSYTPDFYLSKQRTFHEVKGWMDGRSRYKIAKCLRHMKVNLIVVGPREMTDLGLIDKHERIIKHAA